ncbi:hypothetical protein D9Q98_005151 [Chlorella vulgaris]|uniref:Glutaredoxin domain-containing protein n=1 Tax=Chlorella vulgaris TaxID=3077 RepID=A0A9D4YWZ8_CHLVU|nr:hypothetical protein D9Q98_005151 [Chlorella vulgaris]
MSAVLGLCQASAGCCPAIQPRKVVIRPLARLPVVARTRSSRRALVAASQAPGSPAAPGSTMSPELKSAIDAFITENNVVAFIKGTKQFPACGFSNTVVQILNTTAVPYVTVNVLEDDLLRTGMKEYSQWPTFPQVYIAGEFYGGADILIASYTNGELAETLEAAMNA